MTTFDTALRLLDGPRWKETTDEWSHVRDVRTGNTILHRILADPPGPVRNRRLLRASFAVSNIRELMEKQNNFGQTVDNLLGTQHEENTNEENTDEKNIEGIIKMIHSKVNFKEIERQADAAYERCFRSYIQDEADDIGIDWSYLSPYRSGYLYFKEKVARPRLIHRLIPDDDQVWKHFYYPIRSKDSIEILYQKDTHDYSNPERELCAYKYENLYIVLTLKIDYDVGESMFDTMKSMYFVFLNVLKVYKSIGKF